MSTEISVEVVRVFTNKLGEYGNPVGVVFDKKKLVTTEDRQRVATTLGFSETVFVNSLEDPDVSVFDTTHEVKFAGHALVGAAWLIATKREQPTESIHCSGINIGTWQEGPMQWVRAPLSLTPPWNHEHLTSPEAVEAINDQEAATKEHVFVWAWADEEGGIVRARTFLPDWDILEDQGNGSGSMQRAVALNRSLEIHHGVGSVIYARPALNDQAEVGGRTYLDKPRSIAL